MQNLQNCSLNNSNIYKCKANENYESTSMSHVSYYANDIYGYLREAEKRRLKLHFNSVQAASRPQLISILMKAVKLWNLSNQTLHLAAYLLDIFMDVYAVATENLIVVTLSCLILADKVEGSRAKNTLKFVDLSRCFGCSQDNKNFKKFESYIFETFKADFTIPTIASFADYFAEHCITTDDIKSHDEESNSEVKTSISNSQFQHYLNAVLPKFEYYDKLFDSVKCLLDELIKMCLFDIKLFNIMPSLLAAACIAAVRRLHNLQPFWTFQLEAVTNYTAKDIFVLKEMIVAYYEKNTINFLKLKVKKHENLSKHSEEDTHNDLYDTDTDELAEIIEAEESDSTKSPCTPTSQNTNLFKETDVTKDFIQTLYSTNMNLDTNYYSQTEVLSYNTENHSNLEKTKDEEHFLTYANPNRMSYDCSNNYDQPKSVFKLTTIEQSEFDSLAPEIYNLMGPSDSKQIKWW